MENNIFDFHVSNSYGNTFSLAEKLISTIKMIHCTDNSTFKSLVSSMSSTL